MGFWKYGNNMEILGVHHNIDNLIHLMSDKGFSNFGKRVASIEPIKLDPERYVYIHNRSISAEEWFGPNANGDAFPNDELKTRYMTFVGCRLSVDHQDEVIVGMVLDSMYIPPQFKREEDKDVHVDGGYIENILALDKRMVKSSRFPMLVEWIEAGKVTDTSMGMFAGRTICSVCGNEATKEEELCDHIIPSNGFKGTIVRTSSGEEKLCYESCYDITFFEDSIIVPRALGGLAGGEGADSDAKILEKMANKFPLGEYIADRKKQIKITSQEIEKEEESEVYSSAFEFIKTKMLQERMGFPEAFQAACEAFNLDSQVGDISELIGKGFVERFAKGSIVYVLPFDKKGSINAKISNSVYEVEIDGESHIFDEEELV